MDATAIANAVEALRPELIAFIQRVVQTPSLPNHEHAVQGIIAERLRALDLAVDIVPTHFDDLRDHPAFGDDGFSADNRINVVGRWAGTGVDTPQAHSLILNGHVDVVPAGDESLWSDSPWSGAVHDGKLYGRGSCDMKSGVATAIFAVAALKSLGFQPARNLMIESVIGEESGGVGTLTTIVKGYHADACVVLEPTRMQLCPVQSGALTFRLTVRGKAAHAATRQYGVSAIEKFALLHGAIMQLEAKRHESFENELYDEPRYAAPISIGTVRGGEWHSTVSEQVVAEGRMGVFPGEQPEMARAALQEAVNAVVKDDAWLRDHPPLLEWFEGQFESGATDPDHPLIQTLAAIHTSVLGEQPLVRGVPYGSDLRLFTNHANIPTVLYGAGDVGLAHGVDEHIVLDDVVEAVKIIAQLIVRWCGGTHA